MLKEPIVQVAGIIDAQEAQALCAVGIRWLGFPLRLDVHPEDLSEEEARRVIAALPPESMPVLITYEPDPRSLKELALFLGVRAVQVHGDLDVDSLRAFRSACPDLFLIKSLVVGRGPWQELLKTMDLMAPLVDAFITDTYDPETGACGATGKVHDWSWSARIVARSPKPVILAGGLHGENVAEAIRVVRPAGVDAHTGLEGPDGRKDMEKVKRFHRKALEAFAAWM
ncbi:phosphoribosylanthranilate isomerase [Desulfacinum hydrothermale DSM 13146]|uniref:N-(5'-phosphoribosyl)anthranilate isomerase n=1 Tax=Desulfacinum hydrothermale DSM 13146 TaxID=1121390 RepID=A0A1W1X4T4_9BACT|nr:phosphoribosylanthranilate isomerase [Desulfacinum hydrothermale]SMC18969.1 phosphoribosylanthranilate isomerase [Desulfacinum hydrothermale DSM 13146]